MQICFIHKKLQCEQWKPHTQVWMFHVVKMERLFWFLSSICMMLHRSKAFMSLCSPIKHISYKGTLLIIWCGGDYSEDLHYWKLELFCGCLIFLCIFFGAHRKITIFLSVSKYPDKKIRKPTEKLYDFSMCNNTHTEKISTHRKMQLILSVL